MLQPSHRGIYEFLWSEHKYPVMAVSLKAFQGMASRLGRRPQLLALLRKIAEYTFADKTENYNALLNAYMHIKPVISRARRHEIIETLLADEKLATRLIYEDAVQFHESSLAGCRLFYPGAHAIFKCWDSQERPGLWLCFGPIQMHLLPQQVFDRICIETQCNPDELFKRMQSLRSGVQIEEFNTWSEPLRLALQQNNMVAIPGGGSAWLHPRIPLEAIKPRCEFCSSDFLSAAMLTIEKIWDAAEYPPEIIGQLPDYDLFAEKYNAANHPAINWQADFSCAEAYEFAAHLFWQQWCKDNGQGVTEETGNSDAGVGMQAANEEIDPEEGEHGDDETCD